MKTDELKYHVDSMMEISSRIKCLGELYAFSIDRLKYYQELNKDKGPVDLLSILESGEESSDNLREVYMERQYLGYCKHLQECMEDAGHEQDDLGPILGFQNKNVVQTP